MKREKEPIISEHERWLFLPKNKRLLARLKKSLAEEATIDLGSFKIYLEKTY